MEAEIELIKLKMKKSKNLDKYFMKLAVLKNKYDSNTSTSNNAMVIAAILSKDPSIYRSMMISLLKEKDNALKLSNLQQLL